VVDAAAAAGASGDAVNCEQQSGDENSPREGGRAKANPKVAATAQALLALLTTAAGNSPTVKEMVIDALAKVAG
jgi:hypothetical protein